MEPFDPMDEAHREWRARIDKLVKQHLSANVDLRESIDLTDEVLVDERLSA